MLLTRQIVQQLTVDYAEDQEKLKHILKEAFSFSENITVFGWFLFPHHSTLQTPEFHKELLALCATTGNKGAGAPRGHGKSTEVDLVFPAWEILNDKKKFIVIISDTLSQSVGYVNNLKDELADNPIIRWLYGFQVTDYWRDGDFVTKGNTRVLASAVGKKIRGLKHQQYRPDLLIFDDLENDENVKNEEQRHKLRKYVTEACLPAMSRDGEAVLIGTVLHNDSLLSNILARKDEFASWQTVMYKALNTAPDGTEYALWPELYSVETLKAMRDDPSHPNYKGIVVFNQEYQNEPMEDEARIIRPEWLTARFTLAESVSIYSSENPNSQEPLKGWLKLMFKKLILAVDPAISEKETADFFAMCTVGLTNPKVCPIHPGGGCIWVLDYFNRRMGDIEEQVEEILNCYKTWKHDTVKVEAVAYQKGLYSLSRKVGARENIYPPLAAVVPDKDKVRRARIHSANFSGGLVHLREDHALFQAFYNQLLGFPQDKHDDMFDAYMHSTEETVMRTGGRAFIAKPAGW